MPTPCLGLPGDPQQCDEFSLPGKPRCAAHQAVMDERKSARHEAARGPATARGFGPDWWRNRRLLEKTATHCQECGERLPRRNGKAVFELDHIVRRVDWLKAHGTYDGVNDMNNLQVLCHDCHAAKTRAESQRRPITRRFG